MNEKAMAARHVVGATARQGERDKRDINKIDIKFR